ncbi:MAG: hypothetical protein ACYDER_29800, partial [Ktedonobacteraceae bacterium]
RTWVRRLVCMRRFSPCVKQVCFQRLLSWKYTFILVNKQVEKEELLSCGMQGLHRRAEQDTLLAPSPAAFAAHQPPSLHLSAASPRRCGTAATSRIWS